MKNNAPWAVVLAAGEGTRLRSLTTNAEGRSVPKQFCSLHGGRTLFGDALERARSVSVPDRLLAVVADAHRDLWEAEVTEIPPANVIAQPRNRGTAPGVLLPLSSIAAVDPRACVTVFPSDHHFESEGILRASVLEALDAVHREPEGVVLLGMTPDQPVSDYGWILPRSGTARLDHVARFVEKPPPEVSAMLYRRGGLWNSFVFVARIDTLLGLFERRLPGLGAAFARAGRGAASAVARARAKLYEGLEVRDFSRDVLQGSESSLRVLQVPPCGWTDLGTPRRVEECLRSTCGGWPTVANTCPGRPVLSRALRGPGAPARAGPDPGATPVTRRTTAETVPTGSHDRFMRLWTW